MHRQNIHINEWTAHAGSETVGDPDYIVVVTDPMYTVAVGAHKGPTGLLNDCTKKKKVLTKWSAMPKASTSKAADADDTEDMELELSDYFKTEPSISLPVVHDNHKQGETSTECIIC